MIRHLRALKGRITRAYHARQAIRRQEWEVVTCACGRPYYRLVVPHPDPRCVVCEAQAMTAWADQGAAIRRIS